MGEPTGRPPTSPASPSGARKRVAKEAWSPLSCCYKASGSPVLLQRLPDASIPACCEHSRCCRSLSRPGKHTPPARLAEPPSLVEASPPHRPSTRTLTQKATGEKNQQHHRGERRCPEGRPARAEIAVPRLLCCVSRRPLPNPISLCHAGHPADVPRSHRLTTALLLSGMALRVGCSPGNSQHAMRIRATMPLFPIFTTCAARPFGFQIGPIAEASYLFLGEPVVWLKRRAPASAIEPWKR